MCSPFALPGCAIGTEGELLDQGVSQTSKSAFAHHSKANYPKHRWGHWLKIPILMCVLEGAWWEGVTGSGEELSWQQMVGFLHLGGSGE